MVAKHLGATLVLPDIRGSKPGDEMLVRFCNFHKHYFLFVSLSDLFMNVIQEL